MLALIGMMQAIQSRGEPVYDQARKRSGGRCRGHDGQRTDIDCCPGGAIDLGGYIETASDRPR